MRMRFALAVVALGLSWAVDARAQTPNPPYNNPGPFVLPQAGPGIPGPAVVPGKEYTDTPDIDATGLFNTPGQNVAWDGLGGTGNSFLYTVPNLTIDVDAQAASFDALFFEVINNQSAMIASVRTDPIAAILSHSITGAVAVWATDAQIAAVSGVRDLDSLEVWGADGPGFDDGTVYSIAGDPLGISIYAGGPNGVPFVTQSQIADAIGRPGLFDQIDVDALMAAGDALLFSIAPILNPADGGAALDGGEIWFTPNFALANSAAFLLHGGVLWDTANNVTALFGAEDIDALEAVSVIPEPASLLLCGLGALTLGGARLRRRAKRT